MVKVLFLISFLFLSITLNAMHTEAREAASAGSSAVAHSTIIKPEGRRHRAPYRIITSRYVTRSTIVRSTAHTNGVRIRLKQSGEDNTDIEDFSLAFDSGNEYRMGNTFGIENSSFPLYVKVTYRTWNVFHAVQFDVSYEFVIYAPGTWDVTLFN